MELCSAERRAEYEDGAERSSASGRTPADGSVGDGRDGVLVHVGWCEAFPGFYVEDTGSGIPEDERDRVFESGYTTAAEGTGFGLAIVAEIVTAHDWGIEVTEGAAGGARFEVTTGASAR